MLCSGRVCGAKCAGFAPLEQATSAAGSCSRGEAVGTPFSEDGKDAEPQDVCGGASGDGVRRALQARPLSFISWSPLLR